MKLTVQRKLLLGATAAIAVLAIIASHSYVSLMRAMDDGQAVRRSYELLSVMRDAMGNVVDREEGALNYMLTGHHSAIHPVAVPDRELDENLRRMRRLAASDGRQAARIDTIGRLMMERMRSLRASIALFDSGRGPAALRGLRARRGEAVLEEIRSRMAASAQAERLRLDETQELQAQQVHMVVVSAGAGFLVAILIAVLAAIAISRDLRAREGIAAELETALARTRAADRAKSDFLARMSHELRTPLNSVIGFAIILLRDLGPKLSEQQSVYLQRIESNGRHLLTLINDILDISKIEAGRMNLAMEAVDIRELIDETVGQLQPHDRVLVQAMVPEGLAPIQTDREKLRQVLVNLLSNAIKFTEDGHVVVRVVTDSEGTTALRLDVVDTGIGIPRDRQQAIFEAFEQAEVTTARRYGGTGLGLAICRSICDALQFRLSVVSESGVGSTFSILLSADAPPLRQHVPLEAGTVLRTPAWPPRRPETARLAARSGRATGG